MKITILMDNKTESVKCLSEWGLSILIETREHTYLYDTGSSNLFLTNANNLGIDLSKVESVLISHGHFDHTGGIEDFTKINKKAKIYIHKNAFKKTKPLYENGEVEDLDCSVPWSTDFKEKIKDRLVLTSNVTKVNDELTLCGNIPERKGYKRTEKFVEYIDGKYILDEIEHEQFIVINEGDHINILSGCSHRGVIESIIYAKELFPDKKIKSYIGGMHTYMLKKEDRIKFIEKLKELGVEYIVPLHCTGINMIVDLKGKLEDKCKILTSGDTLDI